MAKYSSVLSTKEVCRYEVDECESILNKYHVNDNDKGIILDMIKEAYFQLGQSYRSGRQYEAYLVDKVGNKGVLELFKMVTRQIEPSPTLAKELDAEAKEDMELLEDTIEDMD